MAIVGGTNNGVVTAALVADGQRIEAKFKTYSFDEIVTLASQVAGTIGVAFIPRGSRIHRIGMNTDTSLGSTTVEIGILGTVAKYRASATFTTTDQWVWNELNAALDVQLTADEVILLTTATATLPASGRLLIRTEFKAV